MMKVLLIRIYMNSKEIEMSFSNIVAYIRQLEDELETMKKINSYLQEKIVTMESSDSHK
jgi:hypothetical protein